MKYDCYWHVYNWIEGQNMSYQNYLYICRQIISLTLYQIITKCLVLFIGKVGDWKNYLSKEQDDKLNVKIALKLKHSGLFFHYTEAELSNS